MRLANLRLVKFTHSYMDNPEEIQIPENTDMHPAREQILPAESTDIHQEGEHGQPEEILNNHPTAKTPKLSGVSELSKTLRRGTRLAISTVLITIASISVTEAGSTTTDANISAKENTSTSRTTNTSTSAISSINAVTSNANIENTCENPCTNENTTASANAIIKTNPKQRSEKIEESYNLLGMISAQLKEIDPHEFQISPSHLPKQDNTQISGYSEKRISRFIGQRQLQDLRLEVARQWHLAEISGSNIPIRGTEDQEELDRLSRMPSSA